MDEEPVEGNYDSCGITLEDQHPLSYEDAAEEFWAALAQKGAMECSVSCMKHLFDYHTGKCPRRTEVDAQAERRDQANLDLARGK